jgi:predicted nucleic-acid-binding protein
MRAVDTNVIVRLFARDDAGQVTAARQALASDSIFVPKTVVMEFEWVLRGVYGEPKAAIVAAIETIMATANVEVEDRAAVERALGWFRRGMDFADALHLASSGQVDTFVSFDIAMRRLAAAIGVRPPVAAP